MKTLLTVIYEIFDSIGRAKAAAHFARIGMYEEAKAVMIK